MRRELIDGYSEHPDWDVQDHVSVALLGDAFETASFGMALRGVEFLVGVTR